MCSVDINLIFEKIDDALNSGYNRLYVNVDDLETSYGFLRILAMQGPKDIVVFEGTFALDECYRILGLLEQSEYDIKDFTIKLR